MPDFKKMFPKGRAFLPVIHAESLSQVSRNVRIAHEGGADGVFLISHGAVPAPVLLQLYHSMRAVYPSWWIGMNFLDLTTVNGLRMIPDDVSGLWVDDAGIYEGREDPSKFARLFWEERLWRRKWQGLYFGGVAFKYQQSVRNLAYVAKLAMPYMDVITTSGEATGKPPSVDKIRVMRNAIGMYPLAIASGITPENVVDYLGLVDCFLVATGVSRSFTELDPLRVKELAHIISI